MYHQTGTVQGFFVYVTCMFVCSASIGQAVHQILLIQAFRPDRLLAMSHIFVAKVLGESFMSIIEQPLDLANIVDSEVLISAENKLGELMNCNSELRLLLNTSLVLFRPLTSRALCPQVKPSTPVLMCSVPGYDASGLVRDLAAEQNKQITSVSIGKTQTFMCRLKQMCLSMTSIKSLVGTCYMFAPVHRLS